MYNLDNIKTGLKFEVELLFKSMNMQLQDVPPSALLAGRRRVSADNSDFQAQRPTSQGGMVPGGPGGPGGTPSKDAAPTAAAADGKPAPPAPGALLGGCPGASGQGRRQLPAFSTATSHRLPRLTPAFPATYPTTPRRPHD